MTCHYGQPTCGIFLTSAGDYGMYLTPACDYGICLASALEMVCGVCWLVGWLVGDMVSMWLRLMGWLYPEGFIFVRYRLTFEGRYNFSDNFF
jgi:hypothetical protein